MLCIHITNVNLARAVKSCITLVIAAAYNVSFQATMWQSLWNKCVIMVSKVNLKPADENNTDTYVTNNH